MFTIVVSQDNAFLLVEDVAGFQGRHIASDNNPALRARLMETISRFEAETKEARMRKQHPSIDEIDGINGLADAFYGPAR